MRVPYLRPLSRYRISVATLHTDASGQPVLEQWLVLSGGTPGPPNGPNPLHTPNTGLHKLRFDDLRGEINFIDNDFVDTSNLRRYAGNLQELGLDDK